LVAKLEEVTQLSLTMTEVADTVRAAMGWVHRRVAFVVLAAAATLAWACATKQDIVITKLRGRTNGRVYPVTFDQAWAISKAIFKLEPTEALEEHKADGYILTSQDASGLSPGTYMGVFIEPGDRPGESKVTFIARRRTPTQAYSALSEPLFHKKFAALIELMGTVGSLPAPGESADGGVTLDAGLLPDVALPPEGGAPRD
jgi:hypothetical protein